MFSHSVYKLVHLIGIIMLFVSLGGVLLHALNDGTKADNRWRKQVGITHGVGLFLVLLGGFGMLARLSIGWPWPGWVLTKVVIWVVLGGFTAVIYKMGAQGKVLWYVVILLGALAAYLAIMKPF